MRRLAAEAAGGALAGKVVVSGVERAGHAGVVTLEPEWSLPLPGYESIVLHFPSLSALLARVEQEDPDVIHVATPGPVGLCGLAAAKLLGLPLVGSYHTELGAYALHLTRDQIVAEATELYVDWFYRQCKCVLAPTLAVADALAARGFGDRLTVWGRGVDAELFSPRHRSPARREALLDGGDLLLLSVGRVSPEKRVDQLVRAYAALREEQPGLRLAIAGDGPARAELESSAPPGVRFLGEVTGDALSELYANADVFCFPSTTDTFGQVLIEAGASGLPAVAAAVGGGSELVRHGENGLLVPPDDATGVAGRDQSACARSGAPPTAWRWWPPGGARAELERLDRRAPGRLCGGRATSLGRLRRPRRGLAALDGGRFPCQAVGFMPNAPTNFFVPGWGASASLYSPGLPPGWAMLEPPLFASGSFAAHRQWLLDRIDALSDGMVLGGHSMGGALAIAAAAARPSRVKGLVLVSPAGLPLVKPFRSSLRDLCGQASSRSYPARPAVQTLRAVLARPQHALRLARDVRALDMSEEMRRVRDSGIAATVLGCTTDTLVTTGHSRRAAALLGARYRELAAAGGHMWMLRAWGRFERELAAATPG